MAVKIVRKPSSFLVKCDECGTKFTCEREDLQGYSYHMLYICKKK